MCRVGDADTDADAGRNGSGGRNVAENRGTRGVDGKEWRRRGEEDCAMWAPRSASLRMG